MEKDIEQSERFYAELLDYLTTYEVRLKSKYRNTTVNKHMMLLRMWCEYVCLYHLAVDLSDVSLGMVRSKFYYYFIGHTHENITLNSSANIIKFFLLFIDDEFGIANRKLILQLNNY